MCCVQNPGYCKNLQRQHAQVQVYSDERPMHDLDNLLPDSGHPAFCVHYPTCYVNMLGSKLFHTNGQCTIMIIYFLTQVTQHFVYNAQVNVGICLVNMFRSRLFQTNDQYPIQIIYCLTQVVQIFAYTTQVIVRTCNVNMLKSKLFQTNGQCTI